MIRFVLVLWGLHLLSFYGTWGFFGLALKQGWWKDKQFDQGKAPGADLYRRGVIETTLGNAGYPAVMVALWYAWTACGGGFDVELVWWHVPLHLGLFIVIQDTLFYWSHRMLHHKKLFRLIHRKHHAWRHVRGLSAQHSHPVETVFNIVAMWAGPVLLGSAFPIVALWAFLRIIETVYAHSGYALDGVGSRHAFHHLHPTKGCLGSFWGPWDNLMGTDKAWKRHRAEGNP